ncbi:uncharacterized protein LOC118426924 [Branchiostoma floridae]|uniref:Uncharacterized protein LOC118426924 n=1 Tax=Branchiostoma floridae TaxID=7739 RepID=A0A9J7N7E7_BRAFL|nr:uncharacterized protein LOC118426924 [Branchiostoma floridae]
MLPWRKLARRNASSSRLELEEADSDYSGRLEGNTGTANSSMEKPKTGETSPLQKFAAYAKYIPKESVALEKFLADQAAVQSIPTEAPGWVYNKTAADLFRNRILRDRSFVNGSFLVTQGNVENNVLKIPNIVKVPPDIFKGFPKVQHGSDGRGIFGGHWKQNQSDPHQPLYDRIQIQDEKKKKGEGKDYKSLDV